MPINGIICQTAFGPLERTVEQYTLDELKAALARLEAAKDNVQNCNCAPSNCCQACQVCQSCQAASCQACQSQCRNCNCNCSSNCDCSGNNGG